MAGLPQTIIIEPSIVPPEENVREDLAVTAMTPGFLLEKVAGGVQAHSTAGTNSQRIFALQNIADAGDIDRAYVIGETTRYVYAKSGWLAYGFVPAAAAAIVKGAALVSNGDGTLILLAAAAATTSVQRESIVGYAAEDLDNSLGGAIARIKLEVA